MCGIAGIVETDRERPPDLDALARMLRLLRHRGPDGEGTMHSPGACLGHRRLAIIDLSDAGRQPFAGEDGAVWSAVNGEIYNHADLRGPLESRGHAFRSRCDSEVVVHLYEEHGAGAVERLEGMFSLAVWDGRRRRLLLARDRFGKKPLYYHESPERIVFASEIAALLASGLVPNRADPAALRQYLAFRFVPSPATGLLGVSKLAPGNLLVWERAKTYIRRYWSPPETPEPEPAGRPHPAGAAARGRQEPLDPDRAAERLRALLGAGVRRRLESDVPFGLLLSGGMDSSAIAVEMATLLGEDFATFSVGFPETGYDESRQAETVARHVGARHHAVRVTPQAAESLPRLVERFGEPFADSSAVATEALARAVRPHVTVVLGGDGGDELLGGYDRHRALALSGRLGPRAGSLLARPLARALGALPLHRERRNVADRALRFAEGLAAAPLERNAMWLACFTPEAARALFADGGAAGAGDADPFEPLRDCTPTHGTPVERAMHADLVFGLPGRMLFKLDIATMSVALEARCPFLDRDLVEWAMRVPGRLKFSGARGKSLLRRAYRDALPPEILRRPKTGFGLPVDLWLRGPLAEMAGDLLSESEIARRGLFRPAEVGRLMREHRSGRRNHDDRLWALLCLELWFRTFIDRRPDGSVPTGPPEAGPPRSGADA